MDDLRADDYGNMNTPRGSSAIAKPLAKAKDFLVSTADNRDFSLQAKGPFEKSYSPNGVRL